MGEKGKTPGREEKEGGKRSFNCGSNSTKQRPNHGRLDTTLSMFPTGEETIHVPLGVDDVIDESNACHS